MNHDILFFFNGHEAALPIYAALEEKIMARIPDVAIRVSKTQISFSNPKGFAFVSFNPCRRMKDRPTTWMTVTFGLHARCDAARIDAATEPYPGRWTHHILICSEADIDDELTRWLHDARAFALSRRRK